MNRTTRTCAVLWALLVISDPMPLFGDSSSPPLLKTSRTIRAEGQPEAYSHGEFGSPFGNRLVAVTSSGRWTAFPYLDVDVTSDRDAKTRGAEPDWYVGAFDLRDAEAGPRRWRTGYISSHGPVVAGPDDTLLFTVQGPFPDAIDLLPPVPGLTKGQQRAQGIPEGLPAEYVRTTWCRTEKSAYYRLPAWKDGAPRPRSHSVVQDLWIGDNPVTKKRGLFALRWDGSLCVWELRDGGKPPTANILRVDDKPIVVDILDLLKGVVTPRTRWDARPALLAAAGAKNLIAAAGERQIVLLPLATGKAVTIERPSKTDDRTYEDLLLSANGTVCVAVGATRPADGTKDAAKALEAYPNAISVWSTRSGKLLWEQKLPDAFFVSRAALHPEGSLLVTWSCPEPDRQRKFTSVEDAQRQEEARFKRGVLHIWDTPTGKMLRTRSFPLTSWPHGISFTPDGSFLTILERGGTCHLIETAKLTNSP